MKKYPVSLFQCNECNSWLCYIKCPECGCTFKALNVAAEWEEELAVGDDDEGTIEGLEAECSECGCEVAVDEFKRRVGNILYYELDSEH